MSTLTALKLVASKRNRSLSPIVQRRNKLASKIHEQLELCEAQRKGELYAPKRLRTIKNKYTGERTTVEAVKRVKEWYWINEAGKLNLAVRYGSKVLELAKGKNSIECSSGDELIKTLELVRTSVNNGELDLALETASEGVRSRFKK
jgi:hypothetical protein